MRSALSLTRRQWFAGAGSLLIMPAFARAAATDRPIVSTPFGTVAGEMDTGVLRFLGIPYGKAPERFARAREVSWNNIFEASSFGPISPQPRFRSDIAMSEDCQVLNIWTPAADKAKRPIMVWLHGGGFQSGSANNANFNGAALAAAHDVVVVTINHRLGPIGSIKLDHLDPQFTDSGFTGMLDIIDALRWVNRAAPAFGGDPGCVTIFGQSGGGGKVLTLLTMPEACRYFHRGIVESGTMRRTSRTPEEGIADTAKILEFLGIDESNAAALKSVPLERMIEAQQKAMQERVPGIRPFSPVIDHHRLPEQPFYGHAPECSRYIPIMVGSTTEELRPFNMRNPALFDLDMAGLQRELATVLGDDAAAAIDVYRKARPNASPSDLYFNITADDMYWSSSIGVCDLKSAQNGAPVYAWRYAYDPDRATRGNKPSPGAGHGQEVRYVFRHIQPDRPAEALELQRIISGQWASFARHGSPNGKGLPAWLPYDAEVRRTMIFDTKTALREDPYRLEREWWQARA